MTDEQQPINPNTGRRTTTTAVSRGSIAYTAYGMQVDFRSHSGERLPAWGELPDSIKRAWIASAAAIWDLAMTGTHTLRRPDAT
jgi:hypothetical protein